MQILPEFGQMRIFAKINHTAHYGSLIVNGIHEGKTEFYIIDEQDADIYKIDFFMTVGSSFMNYIDDIKELSTKIGFEKININDTQFAVKDKSELTVWTKQNNGTTVITSYSHKGRLKSALIRGNYE